jgi:hypothetical protein
MDPKKTKMTILSEWERKKAREYHKSGDPLWPNCCIDCRFMVYKSLEIKDYMGWCLLRQQDKDWREEGCSCGVILYRPASIKSYRGPRSRG